MDECWAECLSLFLSDFFLPESDFALIYISRMIDRERFHPWIINGSRLNLIRKTLSRILIFLFLPFVSFRFEEITGTRKTSVRILIRNFIFLRVLFSQ